MTSIREHRVPMMRTAQLMSVGRVLSMPREFPGECWHKTVKVSWEGDEGRRAEVLYISASPDGNMRPGWWDVRSADEKSVEYNDSSSMVTVGDWLWVERLQRTRAETWP